MSKKYVIDLPNDAQYILINGASENHCYTRVEQVDDLEELNSDYINENFGELQDEAYERGHGIGYQKGFEDGKKSVSEPDRIEVGDEVICTTDNIKLIVTSMYKVGSINWCDGVAQDGKVYSTLIENNQKTGKHYDIQSILEAMRT